MGASRNGARTFLTVLHAACKLSHLPGFATGLKKIIGADIYGTFQALWEPLCTYVDFLVANDDWFNQKDYHEDDGQGEDTAPPS